MIIGERLRVLREEKKLSQGDIEKKTGLLRCYVSRVENGHTVPLSRHLRSLPAPLKSRCTNSFTTEKSRPSCRIFRNESLPMTLCGEVRARMNVMLLKFCRLFSRMKENERGMVLFMAQKMVKRKAV